MSKCVTLNRAIRYASISAYLHVGIGGIGTIVLIVLLVVTAGAYDEPAKDYEDSKVTILWYFSLALVFYILVSAFSILLIIGISKRKLYFMAPFVFLVYGSCWIYGVLALRHFISGLLNRGPFNKLIVTLVINLAVITIKAVLLYPVLKLFERWYENPPGPREEEEMYTDDDEPIAKKELANKLNNNIDDFPVVKAENKEDT